MVRPKKHILKIPVSTQGRYTATGYRSVVTANKEGRFYSTGSSEAHTQYHRAALVNQSREFMRDNSIYKGMIERAVAYIIGNGFNLQARTSNASWNNKVESLFREYWQKPDVKQIIPGERIERIVTRELLVTGEVGIVKIKDGAIQIIESEQICGKNNLSDGVIKNEYGKPIKYCVCGYGKNNYIDFTTYKEYEPKNFIFISDTERPSSIRSVPPCQSAFPSIHRINDICDSEAIAWQMLARMALSVTRENATEMAYGESLEGETSDDTRITELDYALIFHGKPGEDIKGVERNLPSQNFTESLKTFLRLIGLPLGLPIEIIMLDWTNSNYSQSRAVLEQAYQTFIGWQSFIEKMFHRNIYEWKVNQFIIEGLIPDRKDKFSHEWIKPTFPWIDQLKEAEASALKIERGFTTHTNVCKSQYQEREDIVNTRETEIRDAISRAQKIREDTGVDVDWRLFAGLEPEPSGAKDYIQTDKQSLSDANKQKKEEINE